LLTAPPQADPAQGEPVRGRFARTFGYLRHRPWIAAAALWAAAATVLALHSTRLALPGAARFAMVETWLVGLGCIGAIGCPILPMRGPARCLTPQTCRLIAASCFTLALVLTVLTLGGALHFNAISGVFAVILPEAAGIQAANAADCEVQTARREAFAYQRGRLESAAEREDARCAALAGLDRMEAMSVEQLEALVCLAAKLLESKRPAPGVRRLASVPDAGSANGSRARFGQP